MRREGGAGEGVSGAGRAAGLALSSRCERSSKSRAAARQRALTTMLLLGLAGVATHTGRRQLCLDSCVRCRADTRASAR
jgi:hypothetical protein